MEEGKEGEREVGRRHERRGRGGRRPWRGTDEEEEAGDTTPSAGMSDFC